VISDGDFDASGLFFLKKGKIFRNFNEGCSTPASSHRVIAAYIDERRVYTYIYTGWWEIKLFRLSLTYLLLSPPMFFFRYSLLVKVVQHDFFFLFLSSRLLLAMFSNASYHQHTAQALFPD
jgi:hypothetical protein